MAEEAQTLEGLQKQLENKERIIQGYSETNQRLNKELIESQRNSSVLEGKLQEVNEEKRRLEINLDDIAKKRERLEGQIEGFKFVLGEILDRITD